MPIYNCHSHIFTIDHVPSRFLPLGLNTIMRIPFIRVPFRILLVNINPFSSRDLFNRYANLVRLSYKKSQRELFEVMRSYYPADSRFIILPMDMAFMQAGKVRKDIHSQHAELADLRDDFPELLIPFAAVDPSREGVLDMLKGLVEEHGFKGVKLYPPLGYHPDDERLHRVYDYAQSVNIPVMVHCSRGGVRHKKKSKDEAAAFADPDNYQAILKRFPNLRLCLGHFGGEGDWESYLANPSARNKNWLSKILDMMRSGEYPNLYADISYTIFHFNEYSQILKVLLQDARIQSQVLFGSDYYMVEAEKFMEKRLSMALRATLGEEMFTTISETNPIRYLG